jgi:NADPH:quinone reductase-like Zn-dependent oxidoreductase
VTDIQAATLPVAVATSFTALFDPTGLDIPPPFNGPTVPPNSTIVVLGGSGSLGQTGIQFARLAGFDTIITTASKTHEEYLKGLGATHVLDRITTNDARAILEIASKIDYVYDSISSEETNALCIAILSRDGGTFVTSLPYRGADLLVNITAKTILGIFQKSGSTLGPHVYRALEGWLASGNLKPNRTIVFEGLEKVDEALTFQGKGVSGNKIVIKIA